VRAQNLPVSRNSASKFGCPGDTRRCPPKGKGMVGQFRIGLPIHAPMCGFRREVLSTPGPALQSQAEGSPATPSRAKARQSQAASSSGSEARFINLRGRDCEAHHRKPKPSRAKPRSRSQAKPEPRGQLQWERGSSSRELGSGSEAWPFEGKDEGVQATGEWRGQLYAERTASCPPQSRWSVC
jgi:hypothetical protein